MISERDPIIRPAKRIPLDVLSALSAARLVPVVVLDDAADAVGLAGALVAGGLPVAEVTFRTTAAQDSIRAMVDRGDILVGAGTVLTPAQVDEAVGAGASFVVSPGLSRAVVERCREHGVLALPGAVTATEVQAALELGVSTVKFFPAGTCGGAAAIKALTAPFGGVSFVPTGGVGPTNLAEYLAIPAVAAVGGSWMVPRELVKAGDFAGIRALTADAVALVAELASPSHWTSATSPTRRQHEGQEEGCPEHSTRSRVPLRRGVPGRGDAAPGPW